MGVAFAIFSWFCFGVVVGLIAWGLAPRRQPLGLVLPASLGFCGAMTGGLLGWLIAGAPLAPLGWVLSIVLAIATLAVYLFFQHRERRRAER